MLLREKYPELWQFFAGWYYDADKSDEEGIVNRFVKESPLSAVSEVIQQIQVCLTQPSFPWREITSDSNRYCESEQTTREWLIKVLQWLEKYRGEKAKMTAGVQ